MRRREFIVLIAGTAVWPLASRAQPRSKIPRIGIIDDAPIWEHFRRSLRDRGHVEGQTIAFEYRTAQGEPARLADAAADLARLPVDVIATFGTPASRAAKAATTTIPIVAIFKLDMKLISVPVRSLADFDSALPDMVQQHPDAMLMTNDPFQQIHIARIIEFLAKNRIPGMFQTRENVIAGGFLGYGASLPDLFRRGASYVHKILQGTKPADLPVEQPVTFELVINLKTAGALGVEVSPSILARADEVIE